MWKDNKHERVILIRCSHHIITFEVTCESLFGLSFPSLESESGSNDWLVRLGSPEAKLTC